MEGLRDTVPFVDVEAKGDQPPSVAFHTHSVSSKNASSVGVTRKAATAACAAGLWYVRFKSAAKAHTRSSWKSHKETAHDERQ